MGGKSGSVSAPPPRRQGQATHAGKGRLVDESDEVAEEDVELPRILLRDEPELEAEDRAAEDDGHQAARPLELLEILVIDLGSRSDGLRCQVGLPESRAALACDAKTARSPGGSRTLSDPRAAIEKPVRAGRNAVCCATYVPSSVRDDML